ncbi:MAG: L,D-transpeptidase [Proteobacteria bacterium]|nr:L,D-transpeptidase [Pseudomonadota bacterium]
MVKGNKVNGMAWKGFVQAKQRKYEINHTLDKAPFPKSIDSANVIKVNLGKLAWGAYDDKGNLVKWGDASGGKNFCDDIGQACKTVTGTYTIYKKQGSACKSNRFPVGKGGAPMPYCMHFQGGYALHGGNVPDFNASHGCIRVPVREAQWLNQNFVTVGKTRISISY